MPKAKDGSQCFTRENKSGVKYTTCKGTQGKKKGMAKRTGGAPGSVKQTGRAVRTGGPPGQPKRPKAPPARIETGPLNPGIIMPEGPQHGGVFKRVILGWGRSGGVG
jgi:hypothetical protein